MHMGKCQTQSTKFRKFVVCVTSLSEICVFPDCPPPENELKNHAQCLVMFKERKKKRLDYSSTSF